MGQIRALRKVLFRMRLEEIQEWFLAVVQVLVAPSRSSPATLYATLPFPGAWFVMGMQILHCNVRQGRVE